MMTFPTEWKNKIKKHVPNHQPELNSTTKPKTKCHFGSGQKTVPPPIRPQKHLHAFHWYGGPPVSPSRYFGGQVALLFLEVFIRAAHNKRNEFYWEK